MTPASPLQLVGLEAYRRYEHAAMATTFTVHVPPDVDAAMARAAVDEAFRTTDRLEDQLSFYREGSDVTRINRAAPGDVLRIGEATMSCLLTALEVAAASDGVFDPFAGASALAAKGQPAPPHLRDLPVEADDPTPSLAVDPAGGTVTKLAGRRWLDLGAVGKGQAIDEAALVLEEWGLGSALLVAGGSSIRAHGPGPAADGSWPLALHGPDGTRHLGLRPGFGLGASGEGFQPGHIVRRPGRTRPPRRAYALAPSAALADALSTALWALEAPRRAHLFAPWPEAALYLDQDRPEDRPAPEVSATGIFAAAAPPPPDVWIVIPCWHESRRLPRFLPGLCAALAGFDSTVAVQVVDDGSGSVEAEALAAVVEQERVRHPQLRPLHRAATHGGKGHAILAGWRLAPRGCRWLAFADADGAVPPAAVADLVRHALAPGGPDRLIVADRLHTDPAHPVRRSLRRALLGRAFAAWSRWRLRLDAHDPQCGAKVVPAGLVGSRVWSQHEYGLDLELLAAARQAGLPVEDVPIAWRARRGSRLRPKDLLKMLQTVERLRITARASSTTPPAPPPPTP